MHELNKNHFKKFVECLPEAISQEQWVGYRAQDWWNYVSPRLQKSFEIGGGLSKDRLKRSELKELCKKDSGSSDWECLASVMAWGGQNREHGVTLFNRFDEIQPIIDKMRAGSISYLQAYKDFHSIWIGPDRLGMGAAYFTKLIFFCEPNHNGYIMDQWTSKSINILMNDSIVHLTSGHVNKSNTAQNYELFCNLTNEIAKKLDRNGEEIEIGMFSKGGRRRWAWRAYVCEHFPVQMNAEEMAIQRHGKL